ncbi:MAG: hypothetical protein AAF744_01490 [Pseudomonadota bacterium]
MTNTEVFAARVKRINKSAGRRRPLRKASARGLGERLITPLMLVLCLCGGLTAAWDAMDRPTDTPLAMAGNLSVQLLEYLITI